MFFITGNGRSGTVFLADLLGKSNNGHVFHEYPSLDMRGFVDAYLGQKELTPMRLKIIEVRQTQQPDLVYGEVNSYLRYQIPFLRTMTSQIFHLVRNGKDVIRSMMNRNPLSFTDEDDKETREIFPYGDDPYIERWPNMDRFERLCWFWQHTILELCKEKVPIIQFEQMLASYDYLQQKLLNFIGVELDFEVWNYERRILKNETPRHNRKFPKYLDWSNKQKESFERICSKSMEIIGYVI